MKVVKFDIVTSAAGHKIGVIKISRPEVLNALNHQVITELRGLFAELAERRDLRAAILTGEGEKAFVAGADIKEFVGLTVAGARDLSLTGHDLLKKMESVPFPVIAAVNGFALGGGLELALACDFILASNKARWGLPEVTLGLIPGYGGTQLLARMVGRALAKRVAMSGEMFTAQQGYEWGLFAELHEPAALFANAMKLAETIATRAPLAVAWAREAINQGSDRPMAEALKLESELFARTFETDDHNEGVNAFVEKRPPIFQGK